MSKNRIADKTLRLAQLSLLAALVVVLQLLSYVIKIGTFNLALVLIPIVVGAGLLGAQSGALLGAIFGVVVLLASVFGLDLGGAVLWAENPLMTALICLMKGAAAGWIPGLVIDAFRNGKHPSLGIVLGALLAPIINSGLFVGGMLLVFEDILRAWADAWAAGSGTVEYILLGLLGLNFLIEFALNILFAPVILRIIEAVRHQNRRML